MNKLDSEEQAIHAAFSKIKVDTSRIAQGVRSTLHESNKQENNKNHVFRKRRFAPLIAAVVAVVALSTSALAYSLGGFDWFIERVNPAFAEVVEPVMIYTEDQGIKLTVLGAQTFDNTAIMYLSVEDMTGQNRLTQSTNLMAWIRIDERTSDNEEGDEMPGFGFGYGGAELIYFDEVTGIAYFEARYVSDTTIPNPLTFSINDITFSWEFIDNKPLPVSLADLPAPATIQVMLGDHASSSIRYDTYNNPIPIEMLLPGKFAQIPGYPDDSGTWISNMGIVDGQLRIQTIQDMTSRFGGTGVAFSLIDIDGEVIFPAETLWGRAWEDYLPVSSLIAIEEDRRMAPYSITEYIFDVDIDMLAEYELVFVGGISTGVEGNWTISVSTGDTANQIITIRDEIIVMGHNAEFITLNPLGLQVRGSFDRETNTWVRGSGEHGEFVAYVETSEGNIRLIGGSRGYSNTFVDRNSPEPMGGHFDWNWQAESPLDISSVTAIIIEGMRIEIER